MAAGHKLGDSQLALNRLNRDLQMDGQTDTTIPASTLAITTDSVNDNNDDADGDDDDVQ